jgi:hypothetical protein
LAIVLDEYPAHVVDHGLAHSPQGHDGIAAQMRRDEDIGGFQKNMIAADGFAFDHIGGVSADLPRAKRGDQIRLVEDLASAGIDENRPVLHRRELFRAEHAEGLAGQRAVQGDNAALGEQLVELHFGGVTGGNLLGVDIGIVGDHLSQKTEGQNPGNRLADGTDPHETDGRAFEIDAQSELGALVPFARRHERSALGDPPCRSVHQAQSHLRHGLPFDVRPYFGNGNAQFRAGIQIDVVATHAVTGQQLEFRQTEQNLAAV